MDDKELKAKNDRRNALTFKKEVGGGLTPEEDKEHQQLHDEVHAESNRRLVKNPPESYEAPKPAR